MDIGIESQIYSTIEQLQNKQISSHKAFRNICALVQDRMERQKLLIEKVRLEELVASIDSMISMHKSFSASPDSPFNSGDICE